jgi:hypothetical protein
MLFTRQKNKILEETQSSFKTRPYFKYEEVTRYVFEEPEIILIVYCKLSERKTIIFII